MSAEGQAAELVVEVLFAGAREVLRLGGTGLKLGGHGAAALMAYAIAMKRGGSAKAIAQNPGGMAVITIPEEYLGKYRESIKPYKVNWFSVNNPEYDKGYVDVCIKTEDVPTVKHVLERIGVTTLAETGVSQDTEPVTNAVLNAETFEEARESLKGEGQSLDDSLNRITDRDFAGKDYVVAKRLSPEDYIHITTEKATFEGENYTKSTYEIFRGGEKVGKSLNDGRFPGRDKNFWPKLKERMDVMLGGATDDLIFFHSLEAHKRYLDLYHKKEVPKPIDLPEAPEVPTETSAVSPEAPQERYCTPEEVQKFVADIKRQLAENLSLPDDKKGPTSARSEEKASENGPKAINGDLKEGKLHSFAEEYKRKTDALPKAEDMKEAVQEMEAVREKGV